MLWLCTIIESDLKQTTNIELITGPPEVNHGNIDVETENDNIDYDSTEENALSSLATSSIKADDDDDFYGEFCG